MSNETLQAEFSLWLENLEQSTKAVSQALENKPVDAEILADVFDDMQVDARQLEVFRPNSKKNLPYDFKPALAHLATAKRLAAKVNRVLKLPQTVTNEEETIRSPSNRSNYKLPKLDIQKFSGDYAKYHEFIQMFDQAVHNTNLTPVQKFTYLKTYLTGDAEKQISGLPVTEEYYDQARELLKEKYGNERIIIQRLYEKLKIIPIATKALSSIRATYEALEPPLRMLKQLGEDIDGSMLLYNLIIEKYNSETLLPFKHSISSVSELQKTIREIVLFAEKLTPTASNNPPQFYETTTAALSIVSQQSQQNVPKFHSAMKTPSRKCPFCAKEGHWADECLEYKTTTERKSRIRGVCYVCLKPNHTQKECKSTVVCVYCKEAKKHHRSLCPKKFGFPEKSKTPLNAEKQSSNSNNVSPAPKTEKPATTVLTAGEQGTFLTIMTTIKNPTTNETTTGRLILDCCSSHSYILESTAQNLKLPKYGEDTFNIKKFQGESKRMKTSQTEFELIAPYGTAIKIQANTTPAIIDAVSTININSFCEQYPQYKDLYYADNGEGKEIQILIGGDYFCKILTFQHIEVNTDIDLLHTVYGWLIAGKMKKDNENTSVLLTTAQAIERIWSLDQIGISTDSLNEEENEQKALQNFYENIEVKNGRYEVSWPWKEYPPELPDNYSLALGHLRSLIRNYENNPELIRKYDEILKEQEKAGIIEHVNNNEINSDNPTHYLPHHPVISENKSTKIRSVFNGSAKSSKRNRSLNESIYKGKLLLINLAKVLIRVRKYVIMIVSDVKKAFHQIQLKEKDRDVVRFLWLIDITKPVTQDNIKILRFCRTPFGIIASLFLLLATIYYHFMIRNPKYLKIVKEELYSDNLVTGENTVENAVELYKDMKKEFQKMSMNLRKWATNNTEVESFIDEDDRESAKILNVLGITWDKEADIFSIRQTKVNYNAVTKRSILRSINAIFDPLGFVAPIMLPAKCLLKKITEERYDWDDVLPQLLTEEWFQITEELKMIDSIKISRYVPLQGKISLHCFVDASMTAFGVAVYARSETERIQVNLVFAKSRITPNRNLSIPKLELIAVVLGTRCLQFTINALDVHQSIEKFIWSDSKCVLSWIETSKILPVFVTRRIKEIRTLPDIKFRYVPTNRNPADIATRGADINSLCSSIWFTGPEWLKQSEEHWPKQPSKPDLLSAAENLTPDNVEISVMLNVPTQAQPPPLNICIENFSSLQRLYKTSMLIIKACERILKCNLIQLWPNSNYRQAVEEMWILHIQKNLSLPAHLNPFKDEKGIIRCVGRLQNVTQMSYDERNPIFLPNKSPFTRLLILFYHTRLYHVGTQHTLSEIRKKFWFPKGRQTVYTVLQKCLDCRKLRNKPYAAPKIPPLPVERVAHTIPYHNSGIDILGPLYTKSNSNEKQKRWIIIITCLVTRAVHLEMLDNITAEEVLNSLRLFIAERGVPALIISDNAPQFKLLDDFFSVQWKQAVNDPTFISYIHEKGIVWKWIPQLAPWMGGAYERLIRQVKEALKITFHGRILNDKQLRVAVKEVAAILNSRPLTYVGADINEDILTPNKFLFAQFPGLPSQQDITSGTVTNEQVQQSWKKAQRILDQFWKIFSTLYLQSLRDRKNTLKQHRPNVSLVPKIGTIVMLADEPTKRGQWKLAKIIRLVESRDGAIRSVELTLPNGQTTVRPITKLIPLELPLEDKERQVGDNVNEAIGQVGQQEARDNDFEIVEMEILYEE